MKWHRGIVKLRELIGWVLPMPVGILTDLFQVFILGPQIETLILTHKVLGLVHYGQTALILDCVVKPIVFAILNLLMRAIHLKIWFAKTCSWQSDRCSIMGVMHRWVRTFWFLMILIDRARHYRGRPFDCKYVWCSLEHFLRWHFPKTPGRILPICLTILWRL